MRKKIFIRQQKQSTEDPIIFTLYPGSREEPMSETVNKVISSLKTKYKNTTFYSDDAYDGTNIKIKLREYGGTIISITEPTLNCVRDFASNAFKKI